MTLLASLGVPCTGRTYPVGMCIAVLLVTLSCLLPILVGTGVSEEPYSVWQDGYFIHLAGGVQTYCIMMSPERVSG